MRKANTEFTFSAKDNTVEAWIMATCSSFLKFCEEKEREAENRHVSCMNKGNVGYRLGLEFSGDACGTAYPIASEMLTH